MNTTQTMEERFNKIFVREDGCLAIGKYDYSAITSFIRQETELAVQKREEELAENITEARDKWDGAVEGLEVFADVLTLLTKDPT